MLYTRGQINLAVRFQVKFSKFKSTGHEKGQAQRSQSIAFTKEGEGKGCRKQEKGRKGGVKNSNEYKVIQYLLDD